MMTTVLFCLEKGVAAMSLFKVGEVGGKKL